MKGIKEINATALPLGYHDVDTDQIAPSDALKFSKRFDMSDWLFKDWRANKDFIMNDDRYKGANILIAGENFGCGSSREHAPWALLDYGFQAIIAASFADIFNNNSSKVGLVTIPLPMNDINTLLEIVKEDPTTTIHISLEKCLVSCGGFEKSFVIDETVRTKLINGLNEIEMTLLHKDTIEAYEKTRPSYMPATE